ncbi:MAG: acetyltransferase [Alphaproteobacteria bacterium]
MVPILILGGPASGGVVLQGILDLNRHSEIAPFECVGFLNDAEPVGASIHGYPVRGGFDSWRDYADDIRFIGAVFHPDEMRARHTRVAGLGIPEERWASVVHPAAWVADTATLGPGCFIASGVVLGPDVRVGSRTMIRSNVYVGHHSTIGDFTFIGSNASINGRCIVGSRVHLGANCVLRDGVAIGDDGFVGIGAAVTKDVAAGDAVAGNPARRLPRSRAAGADG